jgi:hypothetical protein
MHRHPGRVQGIKSHIVLIDGTLGSGQREFSLGRVDRIVPLQVSGPGFRQPSALRAKEIILALVSGPMPATKTVRTLSHHK